MRGRDASFATESYGWTIIPIGVDYDRGVVIALPTKGTAMKQIQADLWQTGTESPFPGLTTHAYLLHREAGNVLFYNTSLVEDIEAMSGLGGVAWQLLSHRDELGSSLQGIRTRYGARLGGHVAERQDFAHYLVPDLLFERREMIVDGIEVIPVPGHSPGSVCFVVTSITGLRYLFTGDTLFLGGNGLWRAGFIPGHNSEEDRQQIAESLQLLVDLAPDLVIGSAFATAPGWQKICAADWPAMVAQARKALLAGG